MANKTMLKKYRRGILLLFLLLIFLAMTFQLVLPDRTFSDLENRSLKQAPTYSLTAVRNGSYFKELSSYLEDQFPGRDTFISLKAHMEKILFRQENNDVYIYSSKNLIGKFVPNSDELTREKAAVLNGFAKEHPQVRFSIMLVPNKSEILKEELPPFAPEPSELGYQTKLYSMLTQGITRIDLIPAFTENKDQYLYFRSDHHWTQQGAFLAQQEYLAAIGAVPRTSTEYDIRKVARDFQGTLTSKSGIAPSSPDEIDLYVPQTPERIVVNYTEEQQKGTSFYQMDRLSEKDKYRVFLGGNYPIVRINTGSIQDRRLLIIKDSYANAFVPFLSNTFNEITMADLRYYNGDVNRLVDEYLITDILVLYNISTFNEDNSILNIADTLSQQPVLPELPESTETGQSDPVKSGEVQVSVKADPHNPDAVYVMLKNGTRQEIKYSRRIRIEKDNGGTWSEIQSIPGYSWDLAEKPLGPGANAEYLLDLTQAFGPLSEGRYRLSQPYDQDSVTDTILQFWGSR